MTFTNKAMAARGGEAARREFRGMTCYAVILADPPWRYRAWKGDRGMRTAESFYPTMTAADLHALRAHR